MDIPKGTNGVMAHLITTCWAQDPSEHYSFTEIVEMLQSLVSVKKYSVSVKKYSNQQEQQVHNQPPLLHTSKRKVT